MAPRRSYAGCKDKQEKVSSRKNDKEKGKEAAIHLREPELGREVDTGCPLHLLRFVLVVGAARSRKSSCSDEEERVHVRGKEDSHIDD